MRILIMTGARPNFMKVAPLLQEMDRAASAGQDVEYTLVYAGSENDRTLEGTLFGDLEIAPPSVFLGVDSHDTVEIISQVMARMEEYLSRNSFDAVIVVDDLASTAATSIVAKKRGLLLAHLVAGTRSFDINMPKEINRLIIDGLSDCLFTAGASVGTTASQARIYNVGNILIDTLRRNIPRFRRPACLDGITGGGYIVLTVNRQKLLSDPDRLAPLVRAVEENAGEMPVIAPLRPDAAEMVRGVSGGAVRVTSPLSYLEFGYLTLHAAVIVTDSGNIAEEATFNGVPCITLNDYTEHIETVKQGTNILVSEDAGLLGSTLSDILAGKGKAASIPEGWDGHTAGRILKTLASLCGRG